MESVNQENQKGTSNVPTVCGEEDERIDVTFGDAENQTENQTEADDQTADDQLDMSKYNVVDADHLDEDPPIKGQEFVLFSFLSPEGVMNCNVRAVKFRGAFPTMELAKEHAEKLEKTDKYFKIFIGDSGKWLDFDPPSSRVEREMSSNKVHQKILDEQAKQRMDRINALAGKHKQLLDKKEKGKKDRIDESKKAGAAGDAVDKQNTTKKVENEKKTEKSEPEDKREPKTNPRVKAMEKMKERMKQKLAESMNKKKMDNLDKEDRTKQTGGTESNDQNIDHKVAVVGKASAELEDQRAKLATMDRNIENIKKLMAKRKEQNK